VNTLKEYKSLRFDARQIAKTLETVCAERQSALEEERESMMEWIVPSDGQPKDIQDQINHFSALKLDARAFLLKLKTYYKLEEEV
tara:strand:+ start:361 stop:615 length:255 start_codon:yes stop_codon:yes gene_type:complete